MSVFEISVLCGPGLMLVHGLCISQGGLTDTQTAEAGWALFSPGKADRCFYAEGQSPSKSAVSKWNPRCSCRQEFHVFIAALVPVWKHCSPKTRSVECQELWGLEGMEGKEEWELSIPFTSIQTFLLSHSVAELFLQPCWWEVKCALSHTRWHRGDS